MSGHKYSLFVLLAAQEEQLRRLLKVRSLHAELNGLQECISTALDEASVGLRATFAADVERTERWLNQLNLPDINGLGMTTDPAILNAARVQLEHSAREGRQIQETLTVTFTQKADEMGQRLTRRLAGKFIELGLRPQT